MLSANLQVRWVCELTECKFANPCKFTTLVNLQDGGCKRKPLDLGCQARAGGCLLLDGHHVVDDFVVAVDDLAASVWVGEPDGVGGRKPGVAE